MTSVTLFENSGPQTIYTAAVGPTDKLNIKVESNSLSSLEIKNNVASNHMVDVQYEFSPSYTGGLTTLDVTGANVRLLGVDQSIFSQKSIYLRLKENAKLYLSPQFLSDVQNQNNVSIFATDAGSSTLIIDSTGVDTSQDTFSVFMSPGDKIQVVGATSGTYENKMVTFKDDAGSIITKVYVGEALPDYLNFKNGTLSYACYLKGTHIATPKGECKVEDLKAGDMVLTASGGIAKVKWLGYRTLYKNRIPVKDAKRAFPILFKKGSIADNVPHRDLVMSPGHHVSFDGNLISAMNLVNGKSIVQLFDMPSFQYYHVELDQFDILLAEGVPAESYVDTGNRNMFQNAHEVAMNPDFGPAEGRPNIPGITVVRKGPVLEAVRAKLLERANWMQVPEARERVG